MDYLQDESLHSFIYRRLALWGLEASSYSGLISSDGCWYKAPCIPKEISFVFDDIPDDFLITKLFQSGMIRIENDSLVYTYNWLYGDLDKTFYGRKYHGQLSRKISIRFCQKCIKEYIAVFGFGYFHRDWISRFFCEKHSSPLTRLEVQGRTNAIAQINSILRGRFVGDFTDANTIEYPIERVGQGVIFPVKPTLCTLNDFGWFIRESAFELEAITPEYNEVDWLVLAGALQDAYKEGSRRAFSLGQLEIFVKSFSDDIDILSDYLLENMRIIRQPIGGRDQIYEIIMVPNNFSCDKCHNSRECMVSQDNYQEIDESKFCQDYIFDSSSLVKIMSSQGYKFNHCNSLPWSPVEFLIK
ncbi:hypothetical protein GOP87_13280 [Vibrio cholerae]|uniref:hypothetical protein n=1 Tax=Vibrio cholerae TaxID=666 RepID=UPI002DBA1F8F|nr:hypothetical protein [Vibrio cholerae]MEB5560510.1 hypothetical protein [Vibrio cholerae]